MAVDLTPALTTDDPPEIDPDGNTYADASFATDYVAVYGNASDWPATSDGRAKLLRKAMRPLEARLANALGVISSNAQPLQFPRVDEAGDAILRDWRGRSWAVTVIPPPIKEAQVELALAIGGGRYQYEGAAQSIAEYETDRLRVKFGTEGAASMQLPEAVEALLADFLQRDGAVRIGAPATTNTVTVYSSPYCNAVEAGC